MIEPQPGIIAGVHIPGIVDQVYILTKELIAFGSVPTLCRFMRVDHSKKSCERNILARYILMLHKQLNRLIPAGIVVGPRVSKNDQPAVKRCVSTSMAPLEKKEKVKRNC